MLTKENPILGNWQSIDGVGSTWTEKENSSVTQVPLMTFQLLI